MTERKYSVSEIDELRKACLERAKYGTTHYPTQDSCASWHGDEPERRAEDQLRTYMLAGVTADEIREEGQRRGEKLLARLRAVGMTDEQIAKEFE